MSKGIKTMSTVVTSDAEFRLKEQPGIGKVHNSVVNAATAKESFLKIAAASEGFR